MGKIVEKKRKKKGRPSLLDLQIRGLKEQQQQQKRKLHSAPYSSTNYNSATPTSNPRSTRRNPTPSSETQEHENYESSGTRTDKKLKLVRKLELQQSPENSLNSNTKGDATAHSYDRKPEISAIGDGSRVREGVKVETFVRDIQNVKGAGLESGQATPLPDEKILLFILDRLQQKDIYAVYSEPVDPEELPDYHEIIEHPMDFATIRKKLADGVYTKLEQFEKDVFLICSNAMQYNAPDTIYYRQARSIEDLAKKNFSNLRQDSDDNEPEPEPKVVRRGRPPKKTVGGPSLERTGSEFGSGATLATGAESSTKGRPHLSDKFGFADSSGRVHSSRDVYMSLLSDNKYERNNEGSIFRGSSLKNLKRSFVLDENRRNTYMLPLNGAGESSVLATFDGQMKQLMAVGLHAENGYSRSLSRFASNLGPVGWTIAAEKIEKCLPADVKFGPGWVVDNDIVPQRQLLSSVKIPAPETISSAASLSTKESKEPKLSDKLDSVTSADKQELGGAFSVLNSSNIAIVKPMPSFQTDPSKNGFNTKSGLNQKFNSTDIKTCEIPSPVSSSIQVKSDSTESEQSEQSKQNAVPPDLNVRFQSPASPTCTKIDSTQPELALQL